MSKSNTLPLDMSAEATRQVVSLPVSRREFITYFASAGVVISAVPTMSFGGEVAPRATAAASSGAAVAPEPVVSFHLDQPFLDFSGRCTPYVPPSGLRSGQPIAELGEIDLYRCAYRI
jgi:hypothetical protein